MSKFFAILILSRVLFCCPINGCVQNSPTNNITMRLHSPDFSKSGFYFDLLNAKRSAFIFV